MKVVLVSHSAADAAGAELALLELVRGLRDREEHDLHVVLPSTGPLLDRLRALGVGTSVERYLWAWVDGPASFRGRLRQVAGHTAGALRLAHLLRRLGADVVVTNTIVIPGAAVAARLLRVPHVWCIHEFGRRDHGFSFDLGYARSLRIVARLSRVVVVNSRTVAEEVERHATPRRLRLVQYGVELACDPRNGGRDAARLVLVGTKSPGKGQEDAIRALALLRERGHALTLRLVGGGNPRYVATLEGLARSLEVDDAVESLPVTSDVAAEFTPARLALVCSRAEAFGRVTVEAMKCGTPVVGARAAGTAELIRDGWNGLLYEPGDPADLAARISLLLEDPELAERLAETARAWALERFSVDRYAERFTAVLDEATRGSG